MGDSGTVTFERAPSMYRTAATRQRAALWVDLTCGDVNVYDMRQPAPVEPVTDAIEQFELVYGETPFGCLN